MNFTSDWVTVNEPNFQVCMEAIKDRRQKFLEIGCFEGRSTCWFLQHGLEDRGSMVCIDTFKPYWYEKDNLIDIFLSNVRSVKKMHQVLSTFAMDSKKALTQLHEQKKDYDFIYIDGDHSADGVFNDAVLAWGLLRSGGVMLFDDYEYEIEPTKEGINRFLISYDGQYEIVLKNYQLAVRKK